LPSASMPSNERTAAIRALVEEIDRYLAEISGEGIADARNGIARARERELKITGAQEPACGWLDEALALARDGRGGNLASAIARARPSLHWIAYDYGSPEIGTRFPASHAFASLIGPDALMHVEDFDLGLFVIAPNTFYRDHHHKAPELYVPLTGPHGWRFGT